MIPVRNNIQLASSVGDLEHVNNTVYALETNLLFGYVWTPTLLSFFLWMCAETSLGQGISKIKIYKFMFY